MQRDEEARDEGEDGGERRKEERVRERALGFREYYLVSVDNDTSASFYSPHQL